MTGRRFGDAAVLPELLNQLSTGHSIDNVAAGKAVMRRVWWWSLGSRTGLRRGSEFLIRDLL